MEIEVAFGITLRELRTKKKLSQEKLALECKLDRTFISLLERGLRKPTINTLVIISKQLDIKPSLFMEEVEQILEEN
ncbi:helix-turn-helix transcriptional regulator [Bacillus haimaensis]|uniref:helix-turn-helix domain-containing protein n=1 Tax=Bacillus haimaensis TaxID=3160967 RepID=UPI003AA7F78D